MQRGVRGGRDATVFFVVRCLKILSCFVVSDPHPLSYYCLVSLSLLSHHLVLFFALRLGSSSCRVSFFR